MERRLMVENDDHLVGVMNNRRASKKIIKKLLADKTPVEPLPNRISYRTPFAPMVYLVAGTPWVAASKLKGLVKAFPD